MKKVFLNLMLISALFLSTISRVEAQKENGNTIKKVGTVDDLAKELHTAIDSGDFEETKEMIKKGADVNAEIKGLTALDIAIRTRKPSIEMIDLILQNGANLNLVDKKTGNTFLHDAAILTSSESILNRLIDAGINVNIRNTNGQTPLHFSILNKSSEVPFNALIKQKANVNAIDKYGQTPLHYAAGKNDEEKINKLIEIGAEVDAKDMYERTPFYIALKKDSRQAEMALMEKGADLHATNNPRFNTFGWALTKDSREARDKLVKAGANMKAEGRQKTTSSLNNFASEENNKRWQKIISESYTPTCASAFHN